MSKHKQLADEMRELTFNSMGYYDEQFGRDVKNTRGSIMENINPGKNGYNAENIQLFYTSKDMKLLETGDAWKIEGVKPEDRAESLDYMANLNGMLIRGMSPRNEIYRHAEILRQKAIEMRAQADAGMDESSRTLKKNGAPPREGDRLFNLLNLAVGGNVDVEIDRYVCAMSLADYLGTLADFADKVGQELGLAKKRGGPGS